MKQIPIFIKWVDAANLDKGWHNLESAIKWAQTDQTILQYGFLLNETEDYVLLASAFSSRSDTFKSLFRIPKGWILEMRKLRL